MRVEIKAAIIGGICTVIAAIIGAYFGAYFERKADNEDVGFNVYETDEYISLKEQYDTLDYQKANLENDNKVLQTQNNDLQNQISDIPNLNQEIVSLKEEIENLNQQIAELEENGDQPEPPPNQEQPEEPESTVSKVSIFDLDTFKNNPYWFDVSYTSFSKEDLIDTYGEKHDGAHFGGHGATDKNSIHPIYLLDKKYYLCEGEIAWSKSEKNSEDSAWIEFYSISNDGTTENLIYSTDPITAYSRPLYFSFSVENVEKMKIVRNSNSSRAAYVIYDYLDLIREDTD